MNTVSIDAIQERLKELPPEKLLVVYDFVSYMADRCPGTALETMLVSEGVLARVEPARGGRSMGRFVKGGTSW